MRSYKISRMPSADELQNRSTSVKVGLEPYEYQSDFSIVDDANKKALKSYVKGIKAMARGSMEYRQLMGFLKDQCGLDRCGYHPNIKAEDDFSIEIHHFPYCAEDIIYTIIYKRAERNECLKMQSIIREFIMLHYIGIIGLYPLCSTCHQFDHSLESDVFIPLDNLYGEPDQFFDIYGQFMKLELQDKSKTYFKSNEAYAILDANVDQALVRNYIFVTLPDGTETISLKKLQEYVVDVASGKR